MSKMLYVPVRDLKKLIKEPEGSLKAYADFNYAQTECNRNLQIADSGIGNPPLRKGLMSGIVTIEVNEGKLSQESYTPFVGQYYTLSAQDIHARTTWVQAVIPSDALHPTPTVINCEPSNIGKVIREADEHEAAWIKFKDAADRTDATLMPPFSPQTCCSYADAYAAHGFCNRPMDNAHSMHLQSMMKELARVGTLDVVAKMDNIIETYYNKLPAHENIAPQDSVIAMRDTLQEFSEKAQTSKEKALFEGLAQINAKYAEYAYEKFESDRSSKLGNLITNVFDSEKDEITSGEKFAEAKDKFFKSPAFTEAMRLTIANKAGENSQTAGDDSNIGENGDDFDDVGDDR
jgi:hypothetical protein